VLDPPEQVKLVHVPEQSLRHPGLTPASQVSFNSSFPFPQS